MAHQQLEMLGRDLLGELDRFVEVAHDDQRAALAPARRAIAARRGSAGSWRAISACTAAASRADGVSSSAHSSPLPCSACASRSAAT